MKKRNNYALHWFLLMLLSCASSNAGGAEPYAQDKLAPVDAYMLDVEREIALATSAAHAGISADATVLVMRRDGYDTVRTGSNGFVCLVERAWGGNLSWVGAFWDPQILAPICYNAHAAEFVLPLYLQRTTWVLEGKSRPQITELENAAVSTGALKAPTGTGMAYMMSHDQYLHPDIHRWQPHLMIWMPYTTQADWGENPLAGPDPVVFRNPGGPFALVVIPYGESRFLTAD